MQATYTIIWENILGSKYYLAREHSGYYWVGEDNGKTYIETTFTVSNTKVNKILDWIFNQ